MSRSNTVALSNRSVPTQSSAWRARLRLGRRRGIRRSWRLIAFASLAALVLFAQTSGRAAPGESLPFFTSFSVTGGYKVAGVDLAPGAAQGGFVTGTIQFKAADGTAVPANTDILIEGYVYQAEPLRREGPFVDQNGFNSLVDD